MHALQQNKHMVNSKESVQYACSGCKISDEAGALNNSLTPTRSCALASTLRQMSLFPPPPPVRVGL